MTLVIVLNVLMVLLVLGTIVGMHVWAILNSRTQEQAMAPASGQERVRTRRRPAAARPSGPLTFRLHRRVAGQAAVREGR
jgi:hypothetical protein